MNEILNKSLKDKIETAKQLKEAKKMKLEKEVKTQVKLIKKALEVMDREKIFIEVNEEDQNKLTTDTVIKIGVSVNEGGLFVIKSNIESSIESSFYIRLYDTVNLIGLPLKERYLSVIDYLRRLEWRVSDLLDKYIRDMDRK